MDVCRVCCGKGRLHRWEVEAGGFRVSAWGCRGYCAREVGTGSKFWAAICGGGGGDEAAGDCGILAGHADAGRLGLGR